MKKRKTIFKQIWKKKLGFNPLPELTTKGSSHPKEDSKPGIPLVYMSSNPTDQWEKGGGMQRVLLHWLSYFMQDRLDKGS